MPELSKYHEKHVRITDRWGNTLTGVADHFGPDYCFHEYGTEEDCLQIRVGFHGNPGWVKEELRGALDELKERQPGLSVEGNDLIK